MARRPFRQTQEERSPTGPRRRAIAVKYRNCLMIGNGERAIREKKPRAVGAVRETAAPRSLGDRGAVKAGDNLLSRWTHYHRPRVLNGRVRNGNGCDHSGLVTGKPVDPCRGRVSLATWCVGLKSRWPFPRRGRGGGRRGQAVGC
jgi:hypothetical protein